MAGEPIDLTDPSLFEEIEGLLAEFRLEEFVRRAWHTIEPTTPYSDNWHIGAVCEHLEAITAGEITRLIVTMPPRYMKSTLISVGWPVWEWLSIPGQRWIFCSYKHDLARDHALKRRQVLHSDWFRYHWADRVFPLSTDQELKQVNVARGSFLACSVGASPHGKGGKRIVIDDPHDPEQAESELSRETAIRFYRNSLYSRLDDKRRGAIVLVMQRLNQGDLAGVLLDEPGWVHLNLPGRAPCRMIVRTPAGRAHLRAEGEPLWPAREDARTLEVIERDMGPVVFAGQYQQRPVPPGGYMFERPWFKLIPRVPFGPRRTVRYWDKAGTAGGGAFTAGVKMTQHYGDRCFYIEDVVRGQWSPTAREKAIRDTAALDGRDVEVWCEQEPGSTGSESNLNTILSLPGYQAFSDRVTGDKVVRARPLASMAQAGGIFLVTGEGTTAAPWIGPFLAEIELFPRGRYKDQVDGASGAYNKLALEPESGEPAAADADPGQRLYVPGIVRGVF